MPCAGATGRSATVPTGSIRAPLISTVIMSVELSSVLKNALFQFCVNEPKLYVPFVSGTKSLLTSALNTTLSVASSPMAILPLDPALSVAMPSTVSVPSI